MDILTKDIDAHPHSGIRCVGYLGELEAAETDSNLHITKGKKYKVLAVQGYGDVEDVIFVDDDGDVARACDFFFVERQ